MDEPESVILPIEDSLDLHAFAPHDVRSVVDEYLEPAALTTALSPCCRESLRGPIERPAAKGGHVCMCRIAKPASM